MNVIFMGLQHMETLMAKENVSVQLQLEARELKNACETGTHILNSILFFEKLDAGRLEVSFIAWKRNLRRS